MKARSGYRRGADAQLLIVLAGHPTPVRGAAEMRSKMFCFCSEKYENAGLYLFGPGSGLSPAICLLPARSLRSGDETWRYWESIDQRNHYRAGRNAGRVSQKHRPLLPVTHTKRPDTDPWPFRMRRLRPFPRGMKPLLYLEITEARSPPPSRHSLWISTARW